MIQCRTRGYSEINDRKLASESRTYVRISGSNYIPWRAIKDIRCLVIFDFIACGSVSNSCPMKSITENTGAVICMLTALSYVSDILYSSSFQRAFTTLKITVCDLEK